MKKILLLEMFLFIAILSFFPLFAFCDQYCYEMFPQERVQRERARLNENLIAAARNGNFTAVKVALVTGANVNYEGAAGYTALNQAARKGCDQIVQCLIDHGAAINHKTSAGRTPLDDAFLNDKLSVVNILFVNGVEMITQNRLKELIEYGLSVDMIDFINRLLHFGQINSEQQLRLIIAALREENGKKEMIGYFFAKFFEGALQKQ